MLMEPIILVCIKLMGTAISGLWDLGDTGTTRDYDTLVRSLGWLSGSGPGWQSHKNVTFSPVSHACKQSRGKMSIYLILLHRLW